MQEYISKRAWLWLLALPLLLLPDMLFIVDQGRQVIITEFGKLKYVYQEPGLYVKMPLYQSVIEYEKRMLDFEVPATELTLADQKRLVVDVFMRYKIVDPVTFYRTVRTEGNAKNRLSPLITGAMRNVLGLCTMSDVLDHERTKIMTDIRNKAQNITRSLGIEIIEVRLSKTDLPAENSHAIYRRMISSLRKEAQKWRGKGKEEYLKRCAKADRDSQEITSTAEKEAKELMGQADARRLQTYNQAYGVSPRFAKWYLEFESWKAGLREKNSTIMLPTKILTDI